VGGAKQKPSIFASIFRSTFAKMKD